MPRKKKSQITSAPQSAPVSLQFLADTVRGDIDETQAFLAGDESSADVAIYLERRAIMTELYQREGLSVRTRNNPYSFFGPSMFFNKEIKPSELSRYQELNARLIDEANAIIEQRHPELLDIDPSRFPR